MWKLLIISIIALILGFMIQDQLFEENEPTITQKSSDTISSEAAEQEPIEYASSSKSSEGSSSSVSYIELEQQYDARVQ